MEIKNKCEECKLVKYRIDQLEGDMTEIKKAMQQLEDKAGIDPRIWVAIISLIGIIVSTFGSVAGTIFTSYFKAQWGL